MLSVIIPTRNRANYLSSCLESLTCQTIPTSDFEVIVVNNASSDNSKHVAESYQNRLKLKVIDTCIPGLHFGRHAGMKEANSDILVFCDDDIIANPHWLESIQSAFKAPNVALVGGNNYPLFETKPPEWLLRLWGRSAGTWQCLPHLSILDTKESEFNIDPGYIWGCNFSVRRDALEAAGGFHPDGFPEEHIHLRGDGETAVTDHIRKSGLIARFNSGASVMHRVTPMRMSLSYFKKRSFAQGISDSYSDFRRAKKHSKLPFRQFRVMISTIQSMAFSGIDDTGRKLIAIHMSCMLGYIAGYRFHQDRLRSDYDLRAWVLKENYY